MELLGSIGAFLLACCGLPELIRTLKDGKCYVGWGMILCWFIGEILVLIYVIPKQDFILIFNYLANTIIVGILLYFKIKGIYKQN